MDINEKRLVIRFHNEKDQQLYNLIKKKKITEEEIKNLLFVAIVRSKNGTI